MVVALGVVVFHEMDCVHWVMLVLIAWKVGVLEGESCLCDSQRRVATVSDRNERVS